MSNNVIGPEEHYTCSATAYQSASVCVPVAVSPFAFPDKTVTQCCGDPVVTAGNNRCKGTKNGSCYFTITQDICVSVPIKFGAIPQVGDTYVTCTDSSTGDICSSCNEDEANAEPVAEV